MHLQDKLRNLLVMAVADGKLTGNEIDFLTDRCSQWSIPEDEFAAAIRYAISDEAQLSIPDSKAEQIEMLQELIRMMAADGALAEIEKELFATAAVKMDIADDELQEIIDSVL